jgi:beta-mannanase
MSFLFAATAPATRRALRTGVSVGAIAAVCVAGMALAEPAASAGTSSHLVTRTVTVAPSADTFTATAHRRTNNGASAHLSAGTLHGNTRRAYLRFTVPAGTVTSAKLTLTKTVNKVGSTVSAATTGTSWSERGVVAANAPRVAAGVTRKKVGKAAGAVTLTVTRAFAGHRTVSFMLSAPVGHLLQFASRQAGHGRPSLRVTVRKRVYDNQPPTSTPPTSTPPTSTPPTGCTVSSILVPSCGRWWGVAPMQFQPTPMATAVDEEETIANRPMQIVHTYHVNDQLFPTATEKALAEQPGHNRMLLINWKPATDMSWAAVAAGGADARIDRLAAYIKSTFTERFYLTIFHEPENDVNPAAGSGWTATDYHNMYRHTVLRLRADGVDNAVTVMNYMGFGKWMRQSWFAQLWPGDDVVDWIGLDPYGSGALTGYNARDFATLVDRPEAGYPGYYTWANTEHPGKPIMLCEWGIEYDASNPGGQASFFDTMNTQLADYPNVKALVYYDVPKPPNSKIPLTTVTLNAGSEKAFQQAASSSVIASPQFTY